MFALIALALALVTLAVSGHALTVALPRYRAFKTAERRALGWY